MLIKQLKFSNMKTGLIISCFILLLVSCKHQQVSDEKESISIFESSCEGFCPVYTLEIFPNGKANYIGELNVILLGEKEYQFSKHATDSLFDLVKKVDFSMLKNSYDSSIADLPEIIVKYNNKQISIKGFKNVPAELADLVKKLKQLAYSTSYVK